MREKFKSPCHRLGLQWIVGWREFFVFPPRQIPIRDRTLSRSWGLTGTHSHRKIAISNSAVTPWIAFIRRLRRCRFESRVFNDVRREEWYKIHRRDLTFNLLNVVEVSRQSFVWQSILYIHTCVSVYVCLCARAFVREWTFSTSVFSGAHTRPSKLASSITVQWLHTVRAAFQSQPASARWISLVQVSYWLFTIGQVEHHATVPQLASGQLKSSPYDVATSSFSIAYYRRIPRFFTGTFVVRKKKDQTRRFARYGLVSHA